MRPSFGQHGTYLPKFQIFTKIRRIALAPLLCNRRGSIDRGKRFRMVTFSLKTVHYGKSYGRSKFGVGGRTSHENPKFRGKNRKCHGTLARAAHMLCTRRVPTAGGVGQLYESFPVVTLLTVDRGLQVKRMLQTRIVIEARQTCRACATTTETQRASTIAILCILICCTEVCEGMMLCCALFC